MATKIDHEVAELVLAAMGDAEVSRNVLSRKSGIPLTTLRRKLDGHVSFNFEELYRVAGVLETTPSRFTPRAFVPKHEAVAA
ncbi:helix-turn-helix transcriptional regulator [Leucobacter allii]|uniref:helix-turn-helix transcriptional regulator n=1 Tax=Leucobacter allii TaxID=2932247 RepID=UPI001FD26C9A|nr:helix-turn-helix transcriptional regulator [Leucobacter allii]UOR02008.1 helix-turn-helix transcriptional regulator [Leucobacter allii]